MGRTSIRYMSLVCISMMALAMTGCNVEKATHLVDAFDGGGPSGSNAAVGGVNLVQHIAGKDQDWDRHITVCHLDASGALVLGTSGSDKTLTFVSNGDDSYAVLEGPSGPLRFEKKDCTAYMVKLTPPAQGAKSQKGSATLICTKDQSRLTTTVQFAGCGH